ncbi:MAG: methylated-DNA--[protein]-cysteine S-methyltransferase [Candidatus Eisenbacteria bacterium]
MHLLYHVMSSPHPLGLLFLAASERGLRHVEFMDRRSLKRTIAAHESSAPGATWEPSLFELRPLADQLEELLTGARKGIDWPLDLSGDALSQKVARTLMEIPYGEAVTVAELARASGEPRNVRAIAQAVLTNPLAIVVPCHRVLGADGKLSNYVGGLPRKKFLLMVEQRFRDVGGLDENRVIGELYRRVTTPAEPVRTKKKAVARKRVPVAAAPARSAPAAVQAKPAAKSALKAAPRTSKPAKAVLSAKSAVRANGSTRTNGAKTAGLKAAGPKAAKKRSR